MMDRVAAATCASILKSDTRSLSDRVTSLHACLGLTDWVPGTDDTAFGDVCRARDLLFDAWRALRDAERKLLAPPVTKRP